MSDWRTGHGFSQSPHRQSPHRQFLVEISSVAHLRPDSLSYEAALAYLFADASFGNRPLKYENPERGLERMREVLASLGNPHTRYVLLHITGTKGKGSTSAYAESMLRHLGYTTGPVHQPASAFVSRAYARQRPAHRAR